MDYCPLALYEYYTTGARQSMRILEVTGVI